MKKLIYIFVVLFTLAACSKKEIPEYINTNSADEIKRLELFANSEQLFNNGTSAISFIIKAYGEREVVEQVLVDETTGTYKDSLVVKSFVFKDGRIPEGSIKIYTEDGTEVTEDTFSTTSTSDSIKFYAQAGEIKSDLFAVALEEVPNTDDWNEIVIPVVFQMLPHNDNATAINEMTSEYFQKKIDRLNEVFAGTLQNAPHSVDTKVRFELVTTDPDGNSLEEVGINRNPSLGAMSGLDLYLKYSETAWDPDKYLNIWVTKVIYDYNFYYENYAYEFWFQTDYFSYRPKYTTSSPSLIPFHKYASKNLTQVDDMNQPWDYAYEIGILMTPDAFYDDNEVKFEYIIGKFFGLIPTEYRSNYYTPLINNDVDFCNDTYLYKLVFYLREKTTYTGKGATFARFDSYNIMDEFTSSTTITYEQALRIRNVLEFCPHRQMRKQ